MAQTSHLSSKRKGTGFASDVLKLASGATLAQGIGILVSPLLSRIYAPEAFGVMALFLSIAGTLQIVSCMRYELSIILPESDDEAANLLGVSLCFVFLVTILTIPIIWFGQTLITTWLRAPELSSYLWLIPPVTLMNGVFLALSYWNSRTKQFGRLSFAKVLNSLGMFSSQLGVGLLNQGQVGGLIGSILLGRTISTLFLVKAIWQSNRVLMFSQVRWHSMYLGIKRHRKFPIYGTWTALLNTISWQLPIFLLSSFFSPSVVGFYSFGNQVARVPMMLVGDAVAQVFFQRAADVKHSGQLTKIVENLFKNLVAFGLFPMLMLTLIGKELFATLFGANWAEAGVYTQILSVYMFFNFVSAPLGQLFSVLEKQEIALTTNILLFISRLGALWLGGITHNIILTLVLFSTSGVLVYGTYSLWLMRAAGVTTGEWLRTLLRSLVRSSIILTVGWSLCFAFNLHSWSLIAVYGACAAVYYLWILRYNLW